MFRADDIETLPVESVPDDGAVAVVDEPADSALEPVVTVDLESLRGEISELGDKVGYLESGLRAQSSDSSASSSDEDSQAVIVLDSSQWFELQDVWAWCKPGFSLALFLVTVNTFMVAALLGTRLWSAFSEGWRR